MATLEEAFEQFKQLPDWDRFPMPEVFYEHFKVKKPKPSLSIMDALAYSVPPHESLNKNGKIEIRPPAEGGVREIKEFLTLPVEQILIPDETETCMPPDSDQTMSNPPTEDTTIKILHVSDLPSPDPSDAVPCISHGAPCRDAACSPASPQPQNASS